MLELKNEKKNEKLKDAPWFELGITRSAVESSLINNVNQPIMLIFLSHTCQHQPCI